MPGGGDAEVASAEKLGVQQRRLGCGWAAWALAEASAEAAGGPMYRVQVRHGLGLRPRVWPGDVARTSCHRAGRPRGRQA